MKYPEGGTEIQVGDLVWWNEGPSLGYVQVITETKEEYEGWGLGSPHIFICNNHPFDPSISTGVAHNESCLKTEGVAPLTEDERTKYAEARARARLVGSKDFSSSPFAVTTEVTQRQFQRWVFTAFKQDGTTEVVKIDA